MDPGARPSGDGGGCVEQKQLQEYLSQKKHTLMVKGAAHMLKHTLEPVPTTCAQDGLVHFGDSLMLRSACTRGLLQANITDEVDITDSPTAALGLVLSTGGMLAACPRNVFTVARVHDDDSFGASTVLHFGQAFRLGTGPGLQERPLYLYAGQTSLDGNVDESVMCLHPRAPAGTRWRAMHAKGAPGRGGEDAVAVDMPLHLESLVTGHELCSDTSLKMTQYGNEWRVFGRKGGVHSSPPGIWSFVNSEWAERVVAEARKDGGTDEVVDMLGAVSAGVDAGELLVNPVARAEYDLDKLSTAKGEAFAVLASLYPQLRRSGVHTVRRLRRTCVSADAEGRGTLPFTAFLGQLSYFAIRLTEEQQRHLAKLLETEPGICSYQRFFSLMHPSLPEARAAVVREAYAKLKSVAIEGHVDATLLQKHWNPACDPEVQKGSASKTEAFQDFLRQWEITSADGSISYEVFLEYYTDVSAAIESDDEFIGLVRSGWRL